jgi:pimeloyl-ACP methyl ester carboxylesterase
MLSGVLILPRSVWILLWTPVMGVLALLILLAGGSTIKPPPHPDQVFSARCGCQFVQIPDGDALIPGVLWAPSSQSSNGGAVCIIPGAGDTKTSFKWRLAQALLANGLTVLSIDLPGHGDYRHRPLLYPDCLSTIPAAVRFLRAQPGVTHVGLLGISLGGAMAIRVLAEQTEGDYPLAEALVIAATPTQLTLSKATFYREMWQTYYGSPVVSLLREISVRQIRESWRSMGYRSAHSTDTLIDLLNPLEGVSRLQQLSILLVYSRRDTVAPPGQAELLQQAAPHADLIQVKRASHVMLTLMPEVNEQIAGWLKAHLSK